MREKQLRKLAKAHGVVLADIGFGLRCVATQDPLIIVEELSRRHRIAGDFFRLPVGAQPAFDFGPTINDRARAEGEAAGRVNGERKAPYDIDTPPAQEWLKAYDAARAEQLEHVASALSKVEAQLKSKTKSNGNGSFHDGEDAAGDEDAEAS